MSIHQGYQPKCSIKNPKPPGPENQKVSVTVCGAERPATTEYLSYGHCNSQKMEPMSVKTFASFCFCFFCLGIGIGSIL